jgi:HEPN domain-containing protein
MPLDPVRVTDTQAWLAKATQDLRRVGILLAAEPADPEGALFHSQQAVEKALKGFLTWHDVPFRRVHEIDELGRQCAAVEPSLADLVCRADGLTKYAWRFRYPGAPYEPALDEGRNAFHLAREVVDAIFNLLPAEVLPPRPFPGF